MRGTMDRATTSRSAAAGAVPATALWLLMAAAVLLLLLAAPPASRASEATLVNVNGRGWGHGIGMSQFGAAGYARHGWGYKAILRHYYRGVTFGRVGDRAVRVLLAAGQSRVRVTSAAAFKASDGTRTVTIPGGVEAVLAWAGGYSLAAGDKTWTFAGPVTFKPGKALLRLFNRNANGWPKDDKGAQYRGTLRAIHSGSGFTTVNRLLLEGYLRGVVPRESPSSWPQAALRAQAVAARSYAVRGIKGQGDFDVYCTTASQVYNGYDGEADSTNAAVKATAGIVPISGGRPIVAYFFSTSGGHTENVENVWGGSPVPYLKGVVGSLRHGLAVPRLAGRAAALDGRERRRQARRVQRVESLRRARHLPHHLRDEARRVAARRARLRDRRGRHGAARGLGGERLDAARQARPARHLVLGADDERGAGERRQHAHHVRRQRRAQRAHLPGDRDGQAGEARLLPRRGVEVAHRGQGDHGLAHVHDQ